MIAHDKNLVLANQLVKGRYQLTKEEQNFIYLMVSQINKDDTKFTEYQIHIKDLESAELTQKQYGRYREFAKNLLSKVITIEDDKEILTANWFSSLKYIKGTGIIKAKISDDLKPYLLQLKQEFVQAKLPTLLQFKSKYSSRLFLLLKSDFDRQKKHKQNLFVIYDIEDLNKRFELPKSYATYYRNFKEKFLLKSLEEINEKTDLQVDYYERKTGRKITSIEFCIRKKEKTIDDLREDIKQTQTIADYIPESLGNTAVKVLLDDDLGLKSHDIKHIFEHYRIEDVEQICLELHNSWNSQKLMTRVGFLRGKLKQLDKRKTENLSLNIEKFFDVKKEPKEDLQTKFYEDLIEAASLTGVIKDYHEFCDFVDGHIADITSEEQAELKRMHADNEIDFEGLHAEMMRRFRATMKQNRKR